MLTSLEALERWGWGTFPWKKKKKNSFFFAICIRLYRWNCWHCIVVFPPLPIKQYRLLYCSYWAFLFQSIQPPWKIKLKSPSLNLHDTSELYLSLYSMAQNRATLLGKRGKENGSNTCHFNDIGNEFFKVSMVTKRLTVMKIKQILIFKTQTFYSWLFNDYNLLYVSCYLEKAWKIWREKSFLTILSSILGL